KVAEGLERARRYPLLEAIFHRRSRRIARGVRQVNANSLSYQAQPPFDSPQPLSELEEALLIAATGATGVVLPDRPFQDTHQPPRNILGTPNLNFGGRAAGSTDNSQPTYFLLINDAGTYFLRHLTAADGEPAALDGMLSPECLLERAQRAKVPISRERLFAAPEYRRFPLYLDSNRFLSNVPGSTVLLPIVDLSRQYINALLYLLTEESASRPAFVDDRNFFRPAGIRKWMKPGRDIREEDFALNAD